MKQTNAYQLNLIEVDDPFLVAPINENTQALEDALVSHGVNGTTHSDIRAAIADHAGDTSNPHGVTAKQIGAAETSHNHSAANITSGTLPVTRGGTGNTSVDTTPTSGSIKMVTSGGVYTALSEKADTDHSHRGVYVSADIIRKANAVLAAPSEVNGVAVFRSLVSADIPNLDTDKITSGTLPVGRGGTGNTTVDTAPTSGSSKMVTSGGVYTALAKKYGPDNAGWVTGSYAGNGSTETPQEIALGFRPAAVFIVGYNSSGNMNLAAYGYAIRFGDIVASISTNSSYLGNTIGIVSNELAITENGFSVVLDSATDDRSLNNSSLTYLYLALK